MRRKLGRLAAWLVTAGMLAYLFSRVPLREVMQATGNAAPWTIPALVGIVLLVWCADSFAISKTFTWFVAPMNFRETLVLRGTTYLLALVNYALGQGAFVYFLHRTRGVRVMRAAAAVLLIMGVNLLVLLLLTSLGRLLGARAWPQLGTILLIAYAGLGVYIVALLARPRWLSSRPILDVLLNAGLVGHLKAMAVRVPHIMTLLLLNHVALVAFGVRAPLLQSLMCFPIVLLVAVLPISVQGLGPTQGAMIFFFAQFAPGATGTDREAAVLAASLATQAIGSVLQIVVGLVCIRSQIGRRVQEASREVKENTAEG